MIRMEDLDPLLRAVLRKFEIRRDVTIAFGVKHVIIYTYNQSTKRNIEGMVPEDLQEQYQVVLTRKRQRR